MSTRRTSRVQLSHRDLPQDQDWSNSQDLWIGVSRDQLLTP